ncbi:MAG: hypothetical protein MZV64_32510 [Ignavibacteriales bacterium]|nr:hypothetical protein [Ignavibacteriales bacterium]
MAGNTDWWSTKKVKSTGIERDITLEEFYRFEEMMKDAKIVGAYQVSWR